MNFHVLTLFPEMIEQGLSNSITGRALKEDKISIHAVNIRDFSEDRHRRVDDYTYGGGAGMLMQAQPVYDAWKHVQENIVPRAGLESAAGNTGENPGGRIRTIYVTPQGHTFTQKMAEEFSKEEDLVILCGHYEGIDERVLAETVTDYVSIGDYVLTGGELAAMVMIDAIARLVPGVLHNDSSAETESFHGNLLEYPQYSRPEIWHGMQVPKVLLSGNQKQIQTWRLEQSVLRTRERRPDLYENYQKLQECMEFLMGQKLLHMDMIECIRRGNAELVYRDGPEILLKETKSSVYMHSNPSGNGVFLARLPEEKQNDIKTLVMHQREYVKDAEMRFSLKAGPACRQAVCTRREKLPVTGLYHADQSPMPNGLVIRELAEVYAVQAAETYLAYGYYSGTSISDQKKADMIAHMRERIASHELFGAFLTSENGEDAFAGFIGKYEEGSIGMLTVFPEFRRNKIALALETFMLNRDIEQGMTPYGQIIETNTASLALLEKIGGYVSKTPVFWLLEEK
jgi:tRNA (guanine37-N1)-methyltransferase